MKEYAREAEQPKPSPPAHIVGTVYLDAKTEENISCTEADAIGVDFPHHDPLVMTVMVDNSRVHCCLVDEGSSVNVLYSSAFEAMGLKSTNLRPTVNPLQGFSM